MRDVRKVLLIVNPAAKSGLGRANGQVAFDYLCSQLGDDAVRMEFTQSARHATELAARATQVYASSGEDIFVLGGDGVIHEAAGGVLSVAQGDMPTPAIGVIPVGSGNDYARALGMSIDTRQACKQLLDGQAVPLDAGRVNGTYFVETLSFGVDAAIALQTMELRAKVGKSTPTLYVRAGINQIVNHRDVQQYRAIFDNSLPVEGESLTFAVQIGPFYGGGFKVAPDAELDDGLFDVCIAHPPLSLPAALKLFYLAKSGRHTGSSNFEIRRVQSLDVEFADCPPAQADGEAIHGNVFHIEILPKALSVIMPAK
jgi:YegS/Rv2252/BmrU family lipid kinase